MVHETYVRQIKARYQQELERINTQTNDLMKQMRASTQDKSSKRRFLS